MPWIIDASPLILLGKIDRLELLAKVSPQFIIPAAVRDEVCAGPVNDPARKWIETKRSFLQTIAFESILPEVLIWDVGAGESAVLSECLRSSGSVAVIDDLAARRCAEVHRIRFIGTLGILLKGKENGFIERVGPEIKKLEAAGALLSPEVVRKALKLACEV